MNKFEKISLDQWIKDYKTINPLITDTEAKVSYGLITLPKRATTGSAGYDFYNTFSFILKPGDTIKIPTGIRCKMDKDIVLQMFIRSSLGFKYDTVLSNNVGIVDQDYYNSDNEGHIWVKLHNFGEKQLNLQSGEAMCQGIFTKYYLTEDDNTDGIRNGGFGSTSK